MLQLPLPVLRDSRRWRSRNSPRSPLWPVHASFTKFQALVGPWDSVAEGAYHQLVAV